MIDEQKRILKVLKSSEKPIKSTKLEKIADVKKSSQQSHLRELIQEMNIKYGVPIIAVQKGFMYAKHPSQIQLYRKRLMFRVNALLTREKKLRLIQEEMEEKGNYGTDWKEKTT